MFSCKSSHWWPYTHTENQRSFSGHDTHHREKELGRRRTDQLIYLICIEGIFCADFLPFSHFGKIAMPVNNVIRPSNFALFSFNEYVWLFFGIPQASFMDENPRLG